MVIQFITKLDFSMLGKGYFSGEGYPEDSTCRVYSVALISDNVIAMHAA